VGIKAKDGVVLAVEKPILSKLLKPGANRRIHTVELNAGVVGAGLGADCRALAQRARSEAAGYRETFEEAIPGPQLAERLSLFMQAYTLYGSVRPFCTTLLLAALDADGPHLYMMEPSGVSWGYQGCAAGKGRQTARTELEKLTYDNLTCEQAVMEAARIIYLTYDEAKDKEFELEVSWIGPASGNRHQFIPQELLEKAISGAKEHLAARMDYD
jgi:20S proteasome subunit alpha 7